VLNGQCEVVRFLVRVAGVDVEELCPLYHHDKVTPLILAAYHNQLKVMMELLDVGANRNGLSAMARSSLFYASQRGHTAIVEFILKGGVKYEESTLAINEAVINYQFDTVKKFLEFGGSLNYRSSEGYSALCLAVMQNNFDIMKQLIKLGASVNLTTFGWNGYTPLHYATIKPNFLKELLQAGALVNARSRYGYTPLHIAAIRGAAEAARRLIDAGATVDAVTDRNWTPLQFAVLAGNTGMINLLLRRGADYEMKIEGNEALLSIFIIY
jgi:ankyrin repeat protein